MEEGRTFIRANRLVWQAEHRPELGLMAVRTGGFRQGFAAREAPIPPSSCQQNQQHPLLTRHPEPCRYDEGGCKDGM